MVESPEIHKASFLVFEMAIDRMGWLLCGSGRKRGRVCA
jgi:hypothetical protein